MRLFERLDMFVLGDRLHTKKAVVKKAEKRLEEKELLLKTHDYQREVRHDIKSYRHTANPSPNAPLLKRMVKNPQVLDIGFFSRISLQRLKLVDRPKPVYTKEVRDILRLDRRARKMRPMELHPKLDQRDIPSINEWLKGKGQGVSND
jgi:nicotinamide mononucleotide adenylyltransferase